MVPHSHINVFNKRTAVLTVFLILFAAVIVARLFVMQVISGGKNRKLAESQHSIYKKLLPSRGEISLVDKTSLQSFPVATNIDKYLVYAVPQEIENPQLTAQSLAAVLGMSAADILAKVTKKDSKYVPVKKQLTDLEQQKIKELKLPGIYFDAEETRFYPEQNLLSQVLGFVSYKGSSADKVGLYGLEKYFQDDLSGKSGSLREEKDTAGAWIFGSQRSLTPAQDGVNFILTIDKSIQFEAETVLRDTVQKHGADSGSAIVVNPKTGAVLAMAGFPDFNPNQFNQEADPKVFSNEATVGNYEPGSTFKAITMAAAVDQGKLTPDSTYTDTGKVEVDNYTIKNAEPGARGVQTMTQVLDFSLNTGAIFAKEQVGNDVFLKYLQNFGLGKKTGIELPEQAGDLGNLKANIKVNYDTASFGQGITVTPLQLVQAYTALANGGKMMKPFLVQSKIYPDATTVVTNPQVAGQPITAKTANTISAMLVDVVENGFGKRAAVPGYYIAGKTGTAQVAGANGKYQSNYNIGSFIGYGPVEDPQFVMLVRIDNPRDVAFAESTAAPAWGQMAQFILNYMHIAPTRQLPPGK